MVEPDLYSAYSFTSRIQADPFLCPIICHLTSGDISGIALLVLDVFFFHNRKIFQNFFSTILQYKELEKIEFSGPAGPLLTSTIRKIYDEFLTVLNHFYNENYNLMDINDDAFLQDYVIFVDHITDMDNKLATVVRKTIENCHNLDSTFKVSFN